MKKTKDREILYYTQFHTMMYQMVTVLIDEGMLKTMLKEELSEETKRELIQTYYVSRLSRDIKIEEKDNYGDWNAKIGKVESIRAYEQDILNKIKGYVTSEEMEVQFNLINKNILALSEEEIFNSVQVQKEFCQNLNLRRKIFKI